MLKMALGLGAIFYSDYTAKKQETLGSIPSRWLCIFLSVRRTLRKEWYVCFE